MRAKTDVDARVMAVALHLTLRSMCLRPSLLPCIKRPKSCDRNRADKSVSQQSHGKSVGRREETVGA